MKTMLALILFAACGDNTPSQPDATPIAVDAPVCVRTNGCCDLLPDVHAVAVCAANPAAPCGPLLCYATDCSITTVDTCETLR